MADARLGVLDIVGVLIHGPPNMVAIDAPDDFHHGLSGRQVDAHPIEGDVLRRSPVSTFVTVARLLQNLS